MSDSVRPHRQQPTRLPCPWESPGKNTGVGVAISFSNAWKWKLKVKMLSRIRLFANPWTAAYQAPPSMGSSRQEYWNGVPLPFPTIHLSITHRELLKSSSITVDLPVSPFSFISFYLPYFNASVLNAHMIALSCRIYLFILCHDLFTFEVCSEVYFV